MFKLNTFTKSFLAFSLMLMVFVASYIEGITQPVEVPIVVPPPAEINPDSDFYKQIDAIGKLLEKQKLVDDDMLSELNSGNYTFDSPLISVDPYQASPLTAIILFKTSEPVQIHIHIEGRTLSTGLDYTIQEASTDHIIPIYGLYADTLNLVTLTSIDDQNQRIEKEYSIQTEPLLTELSSNIFNIFKSDQKLSPGFTFSYLNGFSRPFKTAFDENGDYRWYLKNEYTTIGSYNNGKSLFVAQGDTFGKIYIYEMNYLGKVMSVYYSPYGAHHDIEVVDDRLIITGSNNYPNTIEDFIYEVNRSSGITTRTLDYKNILVRTRIYGAKYTNLDWLHMNSVTEYEDQLIVSSNYQSAIVKNDWDGNIDWILSDPKGYPTKYSSYFLTPIGSNFHYTYNQHAVEVLPDTDKNPDTLDIIVFDNGSSRNIVNDELQLLLSKNEIIEPPLYSRIVIFRINEKNRTVQQLWEYGSSRPDLFSTTMGDADLLENGNYLGVFSISTVVADIISHHTVYLEVNPKGKVVYEVVATSSNLENFYNEYRAERFEIYNSSTANLNIGQIANNFIPQELIQKSKDYLSTLGD
jgi:hypothetical protein